MGLAHPNVQFCPACLRSVQQVVIPLKVVKIVRKILKTSDVVDQYTFSDI